MTKKGLTIAIPESPKHTEGSENNPEFGLPATSEEVNMPQIDAISSSKKCTFGPLSGSATHKRQNRTSAFFGAQDIASNVSS